MSGALTNNYSVLKDCLLKIWTLALGARTPFEFVEKNCEKLCQHTYFGRKDIPPQRPDLLKNKIYEIFSTFVFDASLENCFDTQPPFQLDETILTGSFSDGPFLFANEPPDVDFMCVLANIMFSEEDQENGCLS